MIYNSITDTIGNTPLLRLLKIEKMYSLKFELYAKLEYFNPGGSIKDRTALEMIRDALEKGIIKKATVIVEPTSGNTGIGLAVAAAKFNLNLILTMPETASSERISLMEAMGAKVHLTPGAAGMNGAIAEAVEILKKHPDSYMPMQFDNPSNPAAHYKGTAVEIFNDLGSVPDYFIAGVGTGGTITGCARFFKEKDRNSKIIAVEPFESSVISGETPSKHGIQGIGAGFIPDILDLDLIDDVIRIKTGDAFKFSRIAAMHEKVLCGISSGAALAAAVEVASREGRGRIVIIFPDTGERYMSSGLYD